MTAINHALTGAIIGLLIPIPVIAVPVAFLSHFVCDAIPHFGPNKNNTSWITTKRFRNLLIIDASLCILLVLVLFITKPQDWFQAIICAFLATSPDLVWINRLRLEKQNKIWKPSLFSKFASNIQWFEKPIGAIIEVAWFIAGIFIIRAIAISS